MELRPDPLEQPTHVVRATTQEVRNFDSTLQEMFDVDRQKKLREELSVLYVALTRAKHAVYMFTTAGSSKRKPSLSHGAILMQSLAASGVEPSAAGVLCQLGNERWYESLSDELQNSSELIETSSEIRFLPLSKRGRALPRKTPSGLEGGDGVDLNRELDGQGHNAAIRGTIIHRLFETITWLDGQAPTFDELYPTVASLSHDDSVLSECIKEFQAMLSQQDIQQLFIQDRYDGDAEVSNEHPFAHRDGDSIMSGMIDRLVLCRNAGKLVAAEVIDFKTDQPNSLEERVAYYAPQIEAYKNAIYLQYDLPQERITSKLVFVRLGKVIE